VLKLQILVTLQSPFITSFTEILVIHQIWRFSLNVIVAFLFSSYICHWHLQPSVEKVFYLLFFVFCFCLFLLYLLAIRSFNFFFLTHEWNVQVFVIFPREVWLKAWKLQKLSVKASLKLISSPLEKTIKFYKVHNTPEL